MHPRDETKRPSEPFEVSLDMAILRMREIDRETEKLQAERAEMEKLAINVRDELIKKCENAARMVKQDPGTMPVGGL